MSFTPDPSLPIGTPCYHKGTMFYVYAIRAATTKTGTKVMYQITSWLPTDYLEGAGPYPHPYKWFDRADIKTVAEFQATELVRIETEANVYDRTLTGLPVIHLYGDATENIIVNSAPLYSDSGFYITDIEDGTVSVNVTDTIEGYILVDHPSAFVSGNIDLSICGTYERTYFAVDVNGIVSKVVTRTVVVYDPNILTC